jgi:hypothetical protein
MKKIFKIICCLFLIGTCTVSCEEYLDKTIETDLSIDEVFQNFDNSQGWVEEMYAMMVDYAGAFWQYYGYYGEESVNNRTWMFDFSIDQGEYGQWANLRGMFMINQGSGNGNPKDTNSDYPFDRSSVWISSWQGIRKANIAIENAETLMVDATQQERDAIMGQSYFFRAFFHHEIMKFWGSIPYIDRVLEDDWQLPRPAEWSETALKIDEDFDKAIALLPADWDDASWAPGAKTRGQNMFRITKGAAMAMKGKNLLYAASPLMQGSNDTYGYNKELCVKAAEALAQVIQMPRYQLVPWDNYGSVFYSENGQYPYSSEFILSQPGNVGWYPKYLPSIWQLTDVAMSSGDTGAAPTHNYIHNYFGMKDGLACDDSPLYDPQDPWKNRDPRFNKWIVVDGDQLIDNLGAATGADEVHRYAQLYNDGAHRNPNQNTGSLTGYGMKKWSPRNFNKFDNVEAFGWRTHVRLTDVYLMYAEAAVMAYGLDGKAPGFNMSAVDAINAIRERAVPDGSLNVKPQNLTSVNKFMDEIRRERAVEMSYENHRWMDVRRWKLGTDMKYRLKTGIRFDRNAAGKPINFREEIIRTKVFEEKHYWLPFPQNDTELYEGFPQNPGW